MDTKVELGEYSLAKVKGFQGREGRGLNAELRCDGRKVADIIDEGNGGMMFFQWVDFNKGGEEAKFKAFIEAERLRMPEFDEAGSKIASRMMMDGDLWVAKEADRIENERRFRRACKKETLFQVGVEIGGDQWRVVKGVAPHIPEYLRKKYAGQKVRILNEEL